MHYHAAGRIGQWILLAWIVPVYPFYISVTTNIPYIKRGLTKCIIHTYGHIVIEAITEGFETGAAGVTLYFYYKIAVAGVLAAEALQP